MLSWQILGCGCWDLLGFLKVFEGPNIHFPVSHFGETVSINRNRQVFSEMSFLGNELGKSVRTFFKDPGFITGKNHIASGLKLWQRCLEGNGSECQVTQSITARKYFHPPDYDIKESIPRWQFSSTPPAAGPGRIFVRRASLASPSFKVKRRAMDHQTSLNQTSLKWVCTKIFLSNISDISSCSQLRLQSSVCRLGLSSFFGKPKMHSCWKFVDPANF